MSYFILVQFAAGRAQPSISDGKQSMTRSQAMSHGTPPPALPAKNIHTSQLSIQHNSQILHSASANNFPNHHSNLKPAPNTNGLMNGGSNIAGVDRKFSNASQPPMHLNYPPKPVPSQSLISPLSNSNQLPNGGSLRRTSLQHQQDMAMLSPNSNNRATSIGYPTTNAVGPNTTFIPNRTPPFQPPLPQQQTFQQNMTGPNISQAQPQHFVHPQQLRDSTGQFHGQQDRTMPQHVCQ